VTFDLRSDDHKFYLHVITIKIFILDIWIYGVASTWTRIYIGYSNCHVGQITLKKVDSLLCSCMRLAGTHAPCRAALMCVSGQGRNIHALLFPCHECMAREQSERENKEIAP
jgi:hypothetical protein